MSGEHEAGRGMDAIIADILLGYGEIAARCMEWKEALPISRDGMVRTDRLARYMDEINAIAGRGIADGMRIVTAAATPPADGRGGGETNDA